MVAALLADQPLSQLLDVLRSAGVWCAPVNDYAEVESDPAVVHLGCFAAFDHPRAGHVRTLRHPIRYSDAETQVRYLPPEVGEHTADVLAEIGYPPADVQSLTGSMPPSAPKSPKDEDNG